MQPGMAKVVDQPLIEVTEGTEGAKTVTLNSGERVTYMAVSYTHLSRIDI